MLKVEATNNQLTAHSSRPDADASRSQGVQRSVNSDDDPLPNDRQRETERLLLAELLSDYIQDGKNFGIFKEEQGRQTAFGEQSMSQRPNN